MVRQVITSTAALFCVFLNIHAQINLSAIRSASVRDWKEVVTHVDSVLIETEVSNGLAHTSLTMVLTAGAYQEYEYVEGPEVCDQSGYCYPTTVSRPYGKPETLDSVEISASMQLPTDFVVSDMYLWVGDSVVEAKIQDRALARGQYEEIVNRRRDPCLVEFSGDGWYSMQIFPAKTGVSRKVKLVFNHTFDDDSANLITASIPLSFDTAAYYYYGDVTMKRAMAKAEASGRSIKYMKAILKALDGKTYQFDMPGLGSGSFSSASLVLQGSDIVKLTPGIISTSDPSGSSEFFWAGKDQAGTISAGFSVMLAESTVTLEPEPETRIIVVDVRERWWTDLYYANFYDYYYNGQYSYSPYYNQQTVDVWQRAQKLAIACLQNYVKESHKFNVLLAGATVTSVFDAPVAGTVANLIEAAQAIAEAEPSPKASTLDAMEEAITQAGGDVVILITDLMRPYNYSQIIYDGNGNYKEERVSADGAAFDTLIARLSSAVTASGINLFTIDDEWALWDIAHRSGGFRLATLREVYYYTYAVEAYSLGGAVKYRPVLPKLFIDNPYNGGITGVTVTSPDATGIVQTLDGGGYYWWWGWDAAVRTDGIAALGKVRRLGKLPRMVLPRYSSGEALLRVAAIPSDRNGTANLTFTITGKMGGLGFTKKVSGSAVLSNDLDSNVQWAFRKSENLAMDDWYANADSIKAIGKKFHIVTRQTSLLALEPGMELWVDTLSPQNAKGGADGSNDEALTAAPADERGAAYTSNGMNIDSLDIGDMIAGLTAARYDVVKTGRQSFSAVVMSRSIQIMVPQVYEGQAITVKLFDLRGRMIVSRTVQPSELVNGVFRWDIGAQGVSLGQSRYVLKISSAQVEKVFKMPVVR